MTIETLRFEFENIVGSKLGNAVWYADQQKFTPHSPKQLAWAMFLIGRNYGIKEVLGSINKHHELFEVPANNSWILK